MKVADLTVIMYEPHDLSELKDRYTKVTAQIIVRKLPEDNIENLVEKLNNIIHIDE